jgi:hypothetical protein
VSAPARMPAGAADTADARDAVAAVRRADWRFLLPDPRLGRVACPAPTELELVVALRAAGATVHVLEAPRCAVPYDVVVVTGSQVVDAHAARGLLRSGGWLYAEVAGRRSGAAAAAVRAAGFRDVAVHWLWPDARSCREIVPLERNALRAAMGRRDPGARLRLRARAATLLAGCGLLRLTMDVAAVIGRAP